MAAIPSIELETHHEELAAEPAHKSSALTPPTSEDLNKREDASSELSELDMDDDKEENDDDDENNDEDIDEDGVKLCVIRPATFPAAWYLVRNLQGAAIPRKERTEFHVHETLLERPQNQQFFQPSHSENMFSGEGCYQCGITS